MPFSIFTCYSFYMDKLKKHKNKIIAGVIVLSILWVSVSSFLFFSDYKKLHHKGLLPGPQSWRNSHTHTAPTINDIERIQPWMTFAFVNKVFNLPPEYLKEKLNISSVAYPNLTIEATAENKHINSNELLMSLKKILLSYISLSATSTIK